MLSLLIKLFIPNKDMPHDPKVRGAYGVLCGAYGIFLNLLLFAGKYLAGAISGSVAIVADAFNNLSDAASSVVTLLGFVLAGKKPDAGHPYGHGRIEYLAGLGLSVMIIVVGVELGRGSIMKILSPEPVSAGLLPAFILAAAIAIKLYMALYNRRIGKKIHSETMRAASADSLTDAVSTLVVLVSMGVSHCFHINIDGWAGLAVAAFIVYTGVNSAKDTISPLLGKAPDSELVKKIEQTVLAHPEVLGIHDLMVHDYGPGRLIVSLHAEVNGSGDLFQLHDVIDTAETEISVLFGCMATIHMDPIESDDAEISKMRQAVADTLRELDGILSIHDFRMVPGPTHTNLIFDAVIPASDPRRDEELATAIRTHIHQTWPDRYAVVKVDRSYV